MFKSTISNYINAGSLLFDAGENFADYTAAQSLADETWETNTGSVLTFYKNSYNIELIYDNSKQLTSSQISFSHEELPENKDDENKIEYNLCFLTNHVSNFHNLYLEAYSDDSEMVIFLKNDINIHLEIRGSSSDSSLLCDEFMISKITFNSPARTKDMVSKIMSPFRCEQINGW